MAKQSGKRTRGTGERQPAPAGAAPEPEKPPQDAGLADDKKSANGLVGVLDQAVKHVPYVRYAFGLVGIAAATALIWTIFRAASGDGKGSLTGLFVLAAVVIIFMFVLFLFTRIEESNRRFVELPVKILAWLSVAIVVGLVGLATTVSIAQRPKHIYDAMFTKLATNEQKELRDKFKARAVFARRCNDLSRETEHEYVEGCLILATKDFILECSGFTPEAADDEEQAINDFACLNPSLHPTTDESSLNRSFRQASFAPLSAESTTLPVMPAQNVPALACKDTILARLLADPSQGVPVIRGFDVSHHNKVVPWKELINEGNSFVIMKATEGRGFADPAFLKNWAMAGQLGLVRGAYHVMRYGQDVGQQIRFFDSTISAAGRRACDLGPALDLHSAARGKPVPARDLAAIQAWHEWSQRGTGQPVILFANTFFFENFLELPPDLLASGMLWLQHYSQEAPRPPLGYDRPFIWQFSDGRENAPPDFDGPAIDRNRFTGSIEEFTTRLKLDLWQ